MLQENPTSGAIIQAYLICPRQAWLLSRNITGNPDNISLTLGKVRSEISFEKDKKEIYFEGNIFDIVKSDNGVLTVVEVKKTSKAIHAAKMQLIHYMLVLKEKGFEVKGEIRIPSEKKILKFSVDKETTKKLADLKKKINSLLNSQNPPYPEKKVYCDNCSFNEFCWS